MKTKLIMLICIPLMILGIFWFAFFEKIEVSIEQDAKLSNIIGDRYFVDTQILISNYPDSGDLILEKWISNTVEEGMVEDEKTRQMSEAIAIKEKLNKILEL